MDNQFSRCMALVIGEQRGPIDISTDKIARCCTCNIRKRGEQYVLRPSTINSSFLGDNLMRLCNKRYISNCHEGWMHVVTVVSSNEMKMEASVDAKKKTRPPNDTIGIRPRAAFL